MRDCIKIYNEVGMFRAGVYCVVFKIEHRIQGCVCGCCVNHQNEISLLGIFQTFSLMKWLLATTRK